MILNIQFKPRSDVWIGTTISVALTLLSGSMSAGEPFTMKIAAQQELAKLEKAIAAIETDMRNDAITFDDTQKKYLTKITALSVEISDVDEKRKSVVNEPKLYSAKFRQDWDRSHSVLALRDCSLHILRSVENGTMIRAKRHDGAQRKTGPRLPLGKNPILPGNARTLSDHPPFERKIRREIK